MNALYKKYGERVEFYLVYIREAHPTDGRQSPANLREGILVSQPQTLDERGQVSEKMCEKLELDLPVLLDGLDNAVDKAYNAAPDRIYLVAKSGAIAYQGPRGPQGFSVSELGKAIERELADR